VAEQTPNYNLTKPDINEFYDVEVQNNNMDIIDSALKNSEEQLTEHLAESVTYTKEYINYYVDATNGNDLNNGLSSESSFATIRKAIDSLPKNIRSVININLAKGTYSEDVELRGFFGDGTIRIKGDSVISDAVSINSFLAVGCTIKILIIGCNFTNTSGIKANIFYSLYVSFESCKFVETSNNAGLNFEASIGRVVMCTISNQSNGIQSFIGSNVFSSTNSGTGNSVGLAASESGIIGKFDTQPGGTVLESVSGGGVIR